MDVVTDEGDLRRFLQGPYVRILRSVGLVCDSQAAAQDAVHEAVARAWERRARIEHFDRWVLAVALNLARSRWRKLRREWPLMHRDLADVDDSTATVEWLMVLRGLPRRQREVAVLHYVFDLEISAIAEIVRTSEGAVKNALFHARRSLAAALDPAAAEETTK